AKAVQPPEWPLMVYRGLLRLPGEAPMDERTRGVILRNYATCFNTWGEAREDGEPEAARLGYERAMLFSPRNAEFEYNVGNAYYKEGRKTEAVQAYSLSAEFDPRYANAYHNRGVAYYGLGLKEEALRDFYKVMELDPGNAEVKAFIPRVEMETGKTVH